FFEGDTSKFAQVRGKTGTAQKYENGRIAAGKYVSSFVGFFPVESPKYLVLVVIDEPQGAYYGSVVAAPCAGEIFQGIIDLKNIQPS
ncbi:MAG: peptidoglycan glycosyltransferase, partial [Clostridia bacterium]|nr:peptidoglycan glycosyltransferase [Clostridia bacterium]